MNYRRVTHEDRLVIKTCLDLGLTQSEIAVKTDFNKSTISREINRNRGSRGYSPRQATRLAMERQSYRMLPRKMRGKTLERIEEKLRERWPPESISHRLKAEGLESVSAEAIYRYIDKDTRRGGYLWKYLARSRRRRTLRFPREDRRGIIQNVVSIHDRPRSAQDRKKCGHWERDTMIGKNRKTGIWVLTDRKSRFNVFKKLSRRKSILVTKQTIQGLRNLPLLSVTNDRGQEFNDRGSLQKCLGITVYFCDPYSSYQRGTHENRIGVLRRYLPKGTDVSKLHWKQLKKIEFEINNTPMKCLDWKAPYEVMMKKSCTAFV